MYSTASAGGRWRRVALTGWLCLAPVLDEGRTQDAAPGSASTSSENTPPDDLQDQLLESLDNSDERPTSHTLESVRQRMQQVRRRIGELDISQRTQSLQASIVADLSALIQVAEQRTGRGRPSPAPSGAPPRPGSQREVRPNRTEPESSSSAQPSHSSGTPGDDSTADGQHQATPAAGHDLHGILSQVWGHLPAQVRQQMQSAVDEQYLRKHERLIEAYYKRQAQERNDVRSAP